MSRVRVSVCMVWLRWFSGFSGLSESEILVAMTHSLTEGRYRPAREDKHKLKVQDIWEYSFFSIKGPGLRAFMKKETLPKAKGMCRGWANAGYYRLRQGGDTDLSSLLLHTSYFFSFLLSSASRTKSFNKLLPLFLPPLLPLLFN